MHFKYNKIDLARQIKFLENRVNLETINPLLLIEELNTYFPSIPFSLSDIKAKTKIYRGRKQPAGSPLKRIKDFSYVPFENKAKCMEFGRANLPKQSLFYSSTNLDTAQMECITKDINEKIWFLCFGEWEVQEDLVVADIVLHNSENTKTKNALRRNFVDNLIKSDLDEEQYECAMMILDFFGKQFSKINIPSHKHYQYSVFLSHIALQSVENGKVIDGLQYPSVPMLYEGNNIVLQPGVIDNKKIKLVKTYVMICGLGPGMQLQSKIINTSKEITDEEIIWHNPI